jgi:hypothetical protein
VVSHADNKQALSEGDAVRYGIADLEGGIRKRKVLIAHLTSHNPHRLILTIFDLIWSERNDRMAEETG